MPVDNNDPLCLERRILLDVANAGEGMDEYSFEVLTSWCCRAST